MDSNSVRPATKDESVAILSSKGVAERLNIKPGPIVKGTAFIVNERMLLVLVKHTYNAIEAHIAQAQDNWPHIHADIADSLIFIQSLGYNEIYTNVRSELKSTLNLLAKHGFEQIDQTDCEVILKWESR
jgi:hypothetical protein